jgi:hypothetical protein
VRHPIASAKYKFSGQLTRNTSSHHDTTFTQMSNIELLAGAGVSVDVPVIVVSTAVDTWRGEEWTRWAQVLGLLLCILFCYCRALSDTVVLKQLITASVSDNIFGTADEEKEAAETKESAPDKNPPKYGRVYVKNRGQLHCSKQQPVPPMAQLPLLTLVREKTTGKFYGTESKYVTLNMNGPWLTIQPTEPGRNRVINVKNMSPSSFLRCSSSANEWSFDHGDKSHRFEMNSLSEVEQWSSVLAASKRAQAAAPATRGSVLEGIQLKEQNALEKAKQEAEKEAKQGGEAKAKTEAKEKAKQEAEDRAAKEANLRGVGDGDRPTPERNDGRIAPTDWKTEAVSEMSQMARSSELALPSFLSDAEYLRQWITILTSKEKAIGDFKKALSHRRELGLDAHALVDNRFSRVRAEMRGNGIMPTRVNNRVIYFERYNEDVLKVKDRLESVLLVHAYWDTVIEETFARSRAPPVTLLDVSELRFAHMNLGRFRAEIHSKLSYAWVKGSKFYICGSSWSLTACWNLAKPWITKDLAESIHFLAPREMPKLLDSMSPEEVPQWCLEMSPALRNDARLRTVPKQAAEVLQEVRFHESLGRLVHSEME